MGEISRIKWPIIQYLRNINKLDNDVAKELCIKIANVFLFCVIDTFV